MKILILRFSSIGDIVLTTPVIRALATQKKNAEIHFATKAKYANILEANPYLSKIHVLEDSLGNLVKELRSENFDFIVDLHHNLRTKIIRSRLGVKSASFPKLNKEKWLLVNLKVNKLPNKHIVERYMEAAAPLGVSLDEDGLDYFIPEKDEVENDWLPETHREQYIVFALGGTHNTKKLPLRRMIELCDKINKPVILLGGPEDAEVGKEIEAFFESNRDDEELNERLREMGKKTRIFNACGKFSVNQSASIIKNARVVFTHDTGMMHIAAAFRKQIFSIWGNTVPAFGMYPFRTKFVIYERQNLECRPCSKIGHDKCPKGHFKCMNDIQFDFWIP